MRRLYLQFYLTIIAILVIFGLAVGVLWRFGINNTGIEQRLDDATELASELLPPAGAPPLRQLESLDRLHRRLGADFALYGPDGSLIGAAGRPLPPIDIARAEPGWLRGPPGAPTWLLQLSDGRSLVARLPMRPRRPGAWLLAALIAIAASVAVGAYPIARRLTRRLERLKAGVERLGQGDLSTRVNVEGKDEVAGLAESFNRAAGRIEELMQAHRLLLANCSHELRTPLTRINMALTTTLDAQERDHVKADIAELNQLIDEILLASRLDAVQAPERSEDIDLLALAAEEASRDGIGVEGRTVTVRGERVLLRRAVRNLIDNARRHGDDAAPEVRVTAQDGLALLEVRDHGPGVPANEQEKIFRPFYRPVGSIETGKGSGLGLALVRQIARHHGGDVHCRPAEGGGTVFSITLPAAIRRATSAG